MRRALNEIRGGFSSVRRLGRRALFMGPHTCPWWFGYTFDNPLRGAIHDPVAILGGLVSPGDAVADIGCGLGYFSLALAELVGPTGRVIGIDLQPQMVDRAQRRAQRAGVAERIEFRTCTPDQLGLDDSTDFVLAFWMVHEVKDRSALLAEVFTSLREGGRLLIAEPKIHVPDASFAVTVELAQAVGFGVVVGPPVRFSRSVVCTKGG